MKGRFVARGRGDASARKTYNLIDEPAGSDYHQLLDAALALCSTAVLSVGAGQETLAKGLADELFAVAGERAAEVVQTRGFLRFPLTKETAGVLKEGSPSLYGWVAPQRLSSLALLRADGSPWVVSVAPDRVAYVELTSIERLLMGRTAPAVAALLAHQGDRDAVLAVFERRLEDSIESCATALVEYARALMEESKDGLVDAVSEWLESGETTRQAVALSMAARLGFVELAPLIEKLSTDVAQAAAVVPPVYRKNPVLRKRWSARYARQLEATSKQLREVR